MGHDVLIALGTTASPIAFWKTSNDPGLHLAWVAIAFLTFVLGALKPSLRLQEKLKVLAELRSQYCELFFNLDGIRNDVAAAHAYTSEMEKEYSHLRRNFTRLAQKETSEGKPKEIREIQARVNSEIPLKSLWFPPGTTEDNGS